MRYRDLFKSKTKEESKLSVALKNIDPQIHPIMELRARYLTQLFVLADSADYKDRYVNMFRGICCNKFKNFALVASPKPSYVKRRYNYTCNYECSPQSDLMKVFITPEEMGFILNNKNPITVRSLFDAENRRDGILPVEHAETIIRTFTAYREQRRAWENCEGYLKEIYEVDSIEFHKKITDDTAPDNKCMRFEKDKYGVDSNCLHIFMPLYLKIKMHKRWEERFQS